MKEVRFTVHGDPVPKARPRVVNGHAYTPWKTSIHEKKIGLVYRSEYHEDMFEIGKPLAVEADFYMQIPKRTSKKKSALMMNDEIRPTVKPDVDNLLKTVLDALLKIAYADDNQVVELLGRKHYSEEPRTEIRIKEISREE